MALADAAAPATAANPDRQPSPTDQLTVNLSRLSSNNPFRNRLSTQLPSPHGMEQPTVPQYPFPATSKNPFLDASETAKKTSMEKEATTNTAEVENIFKDLSVSQKPPAAFSNGPLSPRGPPPRSGSLAAPRPPGGPESRRERPPRPPGQGPESPVKKPEHRRRASESSTMDVERRDRRDRQIDRGDRPSRTESEERRRRERRREREERHKREKERIAAGGKPRRPFRNLDLIDKLDVTGVYGQGLFHHDGPFDACNPARNARNSRRAPMQAFPEGSMNMAIGGSGPNRSRLDLDRFHGHTEQGFTDYNETRKADTAYPRDRHERVDQVRYVNTTDRTEQVHGEESYGLGTSTFLEGAPASRKALQQRRESEEKTTGFDAGGLQRKKSLAQRLRGMSATRPRNGAEGLRSPDARYAPGTPVELTDGQPGPALSAGGQARAVYTKDNEVNPYDEAFEKKGTEIRFAEQEKPTSFERSRPPASPRANALSRSVTADGTVSSPTEDKTSGGGFLNRMKSLKGGSRRPRPERKESETVAQT